MASGDKTPLLVDDAGGGGGSRRRVSDEQAESSNTKHRHHNLINDSAVVGGGGGALSTSTVMGSGQIAVNIGRSASAEEERLLKGTDNHGKDSGRKGNERSAKMNLKYVALVALVAQNASLVMLMRYTKTRDIPQFTNSTAVVCCETLKLLACLVVVLFEVNLSFSAWLKHLNTFLVKNFLDTLKVAVPAFIYVIQNNLLYIAVENLPAATFQVSYQIKILTTAIFSVSMLGRELNRRQWLSLLLLFSGVAIVQVNNTKSTEKIADGIEQSQFLGFGAVLLACFSSGFAGVYFEKILKGSSASLWTRNIQLGLFGLITGTMSAFGKDGDKILDRGFFYGYDVWVWSVISIQALGGLLVAVVIKYADNILKGFACSVSIIVSAICAYFVFEFEITWAFCFGTALVIKAVYLYSLPAKK